MGALCGGLGAKVQSDSGAAPVSPHLVAAAAAATLIPAAGQAEAEVARRVQQLLSRPKLALAHRRLLVQKGEQEPADVTPSQPETPELQARAAFLLSCCAASAASAALRAARCCPESSHAAVGSCTVHAEPSLPRVFSRPARPTRTRQNSWATSYCAQVTLVQHNTSSGGGNSSAGGGGSGSGAVAVPVSGAQFCSAKEGAAVKCSLSFT